jgi:type II secretory pathway component PulK
VKTKRQQRGAALLLALCCLAVLTIMSAAFFEDVHRAIRDQNASRWRFVAASLANAGMEKAIAAMNARTAAYSGETDSPLGDQADHRTTFSVEVQHDAASGRFVVVSTGLVQEGPLILGKARIEAVLERGQDQHLRVTRWKEM